MKQYDAPLQSVGSIASSQTAQQEAPDVSLGVTVSPQSMPMGARKADLNPNPILDALSKFTGTMLEMDHQARVAKQAEQDQRTKALQNLYNEKLGQDAATDLTNKMEALKADPERLAKTNVQDYAASIAQEHEAKLGKDNLHALQPLIGAYTSAIKDATKEQIAQNHERILATAHEDIQKNLLHPELVQDPVTGQVSPVMKANADITPDYLANMIEVNQARSVPTAESIKSIVAAAKQSAMNGDTRLLDMLNVPINKPGWDGLSIGMKAESKGALFRHELEGLQQKAVDAREKNIAKLEEIDRYKTLTEIDRRLADDPMALDGVDMFKVLRNPSDAHSYTMKALEAVAKVKERSELSGMAQSGILMTSNATPEQKQVGLDAAYSDVSKAYSPFSDQHIDAVLSLGQQNKGNFPRQFLSTVQGVAEDAGVDRASGKTTAMFDNSWNVYKRITGSSNPNLVDSVFTQKDVAFLRKVGNLMESGRASNLAQAVTLIKDNSTPERIELNKQRMAAIQEDVLKALPDAMQSSGWMSNSSTLGLFPSQMNNWNAIQADAVQLLQSYAEIGETDPNKVKQYLQDDLKKMYVDDGNNSWVKVPRGSSLTTKDFDATRRAGKELATRMGIDAKEGDISFVPNENGTYRLLAKGMLITRPDGMALSVSPLAMSNVSEVVSSYGGPMANMLKTGSFADKVSRWANEKDLNKKAADRLLLTTQKADAAMLTRPTVTTPISRDITQSQAAIVKEAVKHDQTLAGILTQEAFSTKVYTDKSGHPTIGMGYNLDKSPAELERDFKDIGIMPDRMKRIIAGQEEMSQQEAFSLSSNTVDKFKKSTAKTMDAMGGTKWADLQERHQAGLTMLAYNVGPNSPILAEALQAVSEGNPDKFAAALNKVGYTDKDTKKFVQNTRLIHGIQAMTGGPVKFNTFISYPKSDYSQAPSAVPGMKPAVVPGALLPQLPMAKAK